MANLAEFRSLGVAENVLCALESKGFETPTDVQTAAIPLLLEGAFDVVAQAQTGTGKTAAFAIPVIQILDAPRKTARALVLTPTRELALQVCKEMESLQGDAGLRFLAVYGGQSIEGQLGQLRRGCDVVVGTPGRVMDLMRRGALDLAEIEFAILDEADEMLDMGFVDDIRTILSEAPADRRMLMFSATMPPAILEIASSFMREYRIVRCVSEQLPTELTEQVYFNVNREDKLEVLARVIELNHDFYGMVFCRTREDADELTSQLMSRGYPVEVLHGDVAQAQRTRTIERFRRRQFNILIATDVAARGIDVPELTHVVNYSIPQTVEAYIHRIGRTGRAGCSGMAVTFVTPAEQRRLAAIERETGCRIRRMELPKAAEIVRGRTEHLKSRIAETVGAGDYEDLAAELLELLPPRELVAALLKLHCKDELLEASYPEVGRTGRRQISGDRKRLFVGLGKMDRMGAKAILDVIFEATGIGCQKLGKVDCFDRFSFIDAAADDADKIVRAFRDEKRNGKPLVTIAREREDAENKPSAERRSYGRPEAYGRVREFSAPIERRPSRKPVLPAASDAPAAPAQILNRKQRRAIQFAGKKEQSRDAR